MADVGNVGIAPTVVSSLQTYTGFAPMTTPFVYPSSCLNRWLLPFPDSYSSSYIAVNMPDYNLAYRNCQPSSSDVPTYSPGMCASGYTLATITESKTLPDTSDYSNRLWYALCCRDGFKLLDRYTCSSYHTSSIVLYRPSISTVTTTDSRGNTTIYLSRDYDATNNATTTSRVNLYEYPLRVLWRASDVSRFPSSYASALASRLSLPTPTQTPGPSISPASIPSRTADFPEPTLNDSIEGHTASPSLSTGAKAGIGVGAAIGALLILSLAFLLFRRNKRNQDGTTSGSEEEFKAVDAPELLSVTTPAKGESVHQQQWR